MRFPAFPQPIAAACRRGASFLAGFVREHAPESSVRFCLILFATTACALSFRIVAFAFANPHEHLMMGELVGLITALLGTGCCGMALRTRSGDSAEAELQKLAAVATRKIGDAAEGG